jgi:hypothetical protein
MYAKTREEWKREEEELATSVETAVRASQAPGFLGLRALYCSLIIKGLGQGQPHQFQKSNGRRRKKEGHRGR